jgi:hypothetical protein
MKIPAQEGINDIGVEYAYFPIIISLTIPLLHLPASTRPTADVAPLLNDACTPSNPDIIIADFCPSVDKFISLSDH